MFSGSTSKFLRRARVPRTQRIAERSGANESFVRVQLITMLFGYQTFVTQILDLAALARISPFHGCILHCGKDDGGTFSQQRIAVENRKRKRMDVF